ncbi:hypothetical protein WS95_15830 [Burkholderia sp. MSMB1826]|nr:hypothetical protein WS95_15830 [Burkholderia sp. MSMB1826]
MLPTAVLPTPAVFWPVAAPIATLYDPLLPVPAAEPMLMEASVAAWAPSPMATLLAPAAVAFVPAASELKPVAPSLL